MTVGIIMSAAPFSVFSNFIVCPNLRKLGKKHFVPSSHSTQTVNDGDFAPFVTACNVRMH